MVGTALVESLVQSIALTHLIRDHHRVSLLLLAAPESGKTTIATAATSRHVVRVAIITGRSVVRELQTNPHLEFLLFNDLSAVRAMSASAVNLLVTILNQVTQDERGLIAFAGKETEQIERACGIIGCMPFKTFRDHRARWRELGFISRMIPFAYSYPAELVATIKDRIDDAAPRTKTRRGALPRRGRRPIAIAMSTRLTKQLRHLSDARASSLGQIGLRLLQNYHALVRGHALLSDRHAVTSADLDWLRLVDQHVSIDTCRPLDYAG